MRKTIAVTVSAAVIHTGRPIRHASITSHNADFVLKLPHSGPRMWFADVRGGRYFTHLEVVRVEELTAGVLERANTLAKKDYLRQYPQFYFLF